jgi:hypothetical protein
VRLTDRLLTIRNQGEAPRGPTAAFFDRFVKADHAFLCRWFAGLAWACVDLGKLYL